MAVLAVGSLFLAGCSDDDPGRSRVLETPEEAASYLQETFQAAPSPVQQNISVVSDALREGDYQKAIVSLQMVKQSPGLNLQQGMAVNSCAIMLERDLIAAMDRGDPRAEKAYQMLREMNRN